jgi:hypothetical protein
MLANLRGVFPAAVVVFAAGSLILTGCDRSGGAVRPSRVDTPTFDGRYRLIPEESFAAWRVKLAAAERKAAERAETESDDARELLSEIANLRTILKTYEDQYTNFTIQHGVIRSGTTLVQEFSLKHATIRDGVLVGVALWHEDIDDPGDCNDQPIQFELRGTRLEFVIGDEENGFESPVILERISSES